MESTGEVNKVSPDPSPRPSRINQAGKALSLTYLVSVATRILANHHKRTEEAKEICDQDREDQDSKSDKKQTRALEISPIGRDG